MTWYILSIPKIYQYVDPKQVLVFFKNLKFIVPCSYDISVADWRNYRFLYSFFLYVLIQMCLYVYDSLHIWEYCIQMRFVVNGVRYIDSYAMFSNFNGSCVAIIILIG